MATCQSLSILCLFSFSLLLLLNPANCEEAASPSNETMGIEGPYGSTETLERLTWTFTIGENETIQALVVKAADVVDAIGFTIKHDNGDITTKLYGNIASSKIKEVPFAEGETIVKISGKHAIYKGNSYRRTISQLTISTNLNTKGYGPYGKGSGLFNFEDVQDFQSPLINSGTFEGLFGQFGAHSRFIESIGLITVPPA